MKKFFSIILIAVLSLGYAKAQQVLFYEDFANGIPASWGNSGTDATGVTNPYVQFTYTHEGSKGAYGDPGDSILSPTHYNGWIIFDSDSLDNGGVQGNFGNGPAPAPQTVTLSLPPINVSSTPYCQLQFYELYRNFESTTVIAVSTDNATWTLDTINTDIALNAESPNPEQITVDLSPVILAGGTPNMVYIQFIMDANYYFWQIDDISVTTLPNYNLLILPNNLQTGVQTDCQIDTPLAGSTDVLGTFYSQIPASQSNSFVTAITYKNQGAQTEYNTAVNLNFYKNGSLLSSYSTTPPVASLPYDMDTIDGNEFFTQGIGQYIVAAYLSADSPNYYPSNAIDTFTFAVTDSVYSINLNNFVQSDVFIYDSTANPTITGQYGTIFQVNATDTVTSITTAFDARQIVADGTQPGTVVSASILPMTIGSNGLSAGGALINTYPKTLTAADITPPTSDTVIPVTLLMDYSSGSPVLAPGLYFATINPVSENGPVVAMPITSITPSAFPQDEVIQNSTVYWQGTDGIYCNINFGHPSSILYASWTRNPGTSPIRVGQPVVFNGTSNGDGSTVYNWTFTDISASAGGFTLPAQTGQNVRDTFTQIFNTVGSPQPEDTFNVCLTVTDNGQTSNALCKTMTVRADGVGIINVSSLSQVTMVPNPTTGRVTITADATDGDVTTTVVDLLGNVVMSFTDESNGTFSKTYDLSSLTNGIYIVKIENAGTIITKKLSIEKQ